MTRIIRSFLLVLCLLAQVLVFVKGQSVEEVRGEVEEYTGFVVVHLFVDDDNNGTIWYTINGKEPNPGISVKYESNFTITDNVIIKARYVDQDGGQGEILTLPVVVPDFPKSITFTPDDHFLLSGQEMTISAASSPDDFLLYQICNLTNGETTCNTQQSFLNADQSRVYTAPFPVPTQFGKYKIACALIPQNSPDIIFATKEITVLQRCGVPSVPDSVAFFAPWQIFIGLNNINCPFTDVLVSQTDLQSKAYKVFSYNSTTGIVFELFGNYTVTVTVLATPPWGESLSVTRQFLAVSPQKNLIARTELSVQKDLTFEERLSELLDVPSSRILVTNITKDLTQSTSNGKDSVLYYFSITPGLYTDTVNTVGLLRTKALTLQQTSLNTYGITGIWEEGGDPVYPSVSDDDDELSTTIWVLIAFGGAFALCCVILIAWECRRRIGLDEEFYRPVTPSNFKWEDSSPTYEEFSDRPERDTDRQVSEFRGPPPPPTSEPVDVLYTSGPLLPYPPHESRTQEQASSYQPAWSQPQTSQKAVHSRLHPSTVSPRVFAEIYAKV
eukprot:TRINITY_DN8157_c0_g1_i1.p1 TRINITY_DN8157_c0_g1~~TRINITY_DN8157_c0_g1_i1.p1  ORF type:complete len:574 (+),score=71.04 TRINITY_DN8157_c0_g1_i1:57-1724(+)